MHQFTVDYIDLLPEVQDVKVANNFLHLAYFSFFHEGTVSFLQVQSHFKLIVSFLKYHSSGGDDCSCRL